ncbi:MAG: hypothetical protein QOF79_978 [Actinomycetota bacterium]|nr:hypothetical protein [Actinomycetota bacterium]
MALTLVGGSSPVKCLAGAAVLVVVSIAMAPLARTLAVYRLHLIDFWAMALGMIVLLPHSPVVAVTTVHEHGAMPVAAIPAFIAVVSTWGVARVALIWRTRTERRAAALSAGITLTSLAVMLAFCR